MDLPQNPAEVIVDKLISTGQSESFLHKAIQEQGRRQVMDTIMEMQEQTQWV
ncbi:syntaxin-121 [Artemisia annua]|uniref:Syntaxin-121 n=1 Tax=Artemisia annua TaxID=35608 RepID=A0A2U1NX37_ARTAN|nr:syntaxin-121 [Artemisia annua]